MCIRDSNLTAHVYSQALAIAARQATQLQRQAIRLHRAILHQAMIQHRRLALQEQQRSLMELA